MMMTHMTPPPPGPKKRALKGQMVFSERTVVEELADGKKRGNMYLVSETLNSNTVSKIHSNQ